MSEPSICPCTSGRTYAECCRPFHKDGIEPPTAEALMRSRYSAFALKRVDHLIRTLHSTHPDLQRPRDELARDLKRTCNRLTYPGVTILESRTDEGEASVTFHAKVYERGRDCSFVEESRFLQEGGGWRYVDGRTR